MSDDEPFFFKYIGIFFIIKIHINPFLLVRMIYIYIYKLYVNKNIWSAIICGGCVGGEADPAVEFSMILPFVGWLPLYDEYMFKFKQKIAEEFGGVPRIAAINKHENCFTLYQKYRLPSFLLLVITF